LTTTSTEHTANLLGALSLVVYDRMVEAIGAAAGHSDTAATTLSALLHFLDRPSIDRLRQVLGLTSSGTVRLVDRLVDAGLARRVSGVDGRVSHLELTTAGRRAARRVSQARAGVLAGALAGLSPAERKTFDRLLSRVLVGFIRGPGAVRWMCRLCDMTACGRSAGHCPVANEARARYAG
jgi:DNA-binding MarR family transcriptional regulator